jgi:hypothetical protein
MPRILAFDIGIKNLAWCCLESNGSTRTILGWDNYNLLSDASNVGAKSGAKCNACSAKAIYSTGETVSCARHCPTATPAFRDLSGALLKKIPKMEDCRAILSAKGLVKVPTKKALILEELGKLYSLPILTKKVAKAPDAGLIEIHDSLKKLITQQSALWSMCDLILLENQPAFKNPTMKSVQILLFATLRDLLKQPPPQLKLVHAGKKVQGVTKGDAGYKDRKSGSEARAEAFLKDPNVVGSAKWAAFYTSAAKKSDLADAVSMCIDASPPLPPAVPA